MMKMVMCGLLWALLGAVICHASVTDMSDEARLFLNLTSRHVGRSKLARPMKNSSEPLTIYFGVSLIQILNFDEKNQLITTMLWKEYQWKDELMTWDPADYGGIAHAVVNRDTVWTPSIILWNNVDAKRSAIEKHQEDMILSSDGSILWVPTAIYKSSCPVDCKNFPFDTQTCTFTFGPWARDTKKLKLRQVPHRAASGVSLEEYINNTEWEITNNTAVLTTKKYDCCIELYSDLTFTLTIRRRPGFYTKMILLPVALLTILVLVIFWIPPQRPDRTGLGMSLFSSFMLLLLVVLGSTPRSGESRIVTYCCTSMSLVTSAQVLSVLIVNLALRKQPMPKWLRVLFLQGFGPFLFVKDTTPKPKPVGDAEKEKAPERASLRMEKPKPEPRNHERDWQLFANVVDRILFILYVIIVIIFIVVVFPKP